MLLKLQNWWKAGEEDAITVYQARLLIPLTILTAIIAIAYLVTIPANRAATWFFPTLWCAGAIPLFLRRRRAVIFTQDVFLVRPACGAILRVPISGME